MTLRDQSYTDEVTAAERLAWYLAIAAFVGYWWDNGARDEGSAGESATSRS